MWTLVNPPILAVESLLYECWCRSACSRAPSHHSNKMYFEKWLQIHCIVSSTYPTPNMTPREQISTQTEPPPPVQKLTTMRSSLSHASRCLSGIISGASHTLSPHLIPVHAIHAHAHNYVQLDHFNIITTPTSHISIYVNTVECT